MGNTLLVTYIIQPHTFCTADSPKMLVFRWLNFITLFILVFSENVCTTLFMLVFSKNICLWHYWVGSDVMFFPFLLQAIIMQMVRRTMNFWIINILIHHFLLFEALNLVWWQPSHRTFIYIPIATFCSLLSPKAKVWGDSYSEEQMRYLMHSSFSIKS